MKFSAFITKLLADWPVKSLSLIAAVILYSINYYNTQESITIDVPLKVILPAGAALSAPHIETIQFTIRDNAKLGITELGQKDFSAVADFSNQPINNATAKAYVAYEKRGLALSMEPLSINLHPSLITIKIEKRVKKEVDIIPNITGVPPEGYEITNPTWNPQQVIISGAGSRLKLIDALTTEEISYEGRKKDFFLNVKPLNPDPFVEINDLVAIEFTAFVSEILAEREYTEVTINCINIDKQLEITNSLPAGSLSLKAPNVILRNLRRESISLTVNCENIKRPGKYTLKITPEIPMNLELLTFSPREIVIDFMQRK